MEPIGLGIDIVELERVRAVYQRHPERFVARICTAHERERARQLADPTAYLAGRFAAKECVLKVLGTGLTQGISWQHVHVIRQPSGAPAVYLSGRALERAGEIGLGRILVTISHGRDYAVAQAMGLRGNSDGLKLPAEAV
jgi:holo-[acyl-carrier protein] synthase